MSILTLTLLQGSEVSSGSPKNSDVSKVNGTKPKSSSPKKKLPQVRSKKTVRGRGNPPIKDEKPCEENESEEANMMHKLDPCSSSSFDGSPSKSSHTSRRLTVWGRTPVSKTFH